MRAVCFALLFVASASSLFAANSDVVITELATGYANSYQWFEVYNRGTGTVDLTGWKIQVGANNYTFNLYQGSSVLSGSTYAVVARVATNFLNSYPDFTGTLFTAGFPTLSNTGRQVTLKDANLNVVESFTYITNLTGTLERRNYDWAEYTASNWENSAAPNGTPNKQNTRKWLRSYFNFPPPHNGSSEVGIDTAFINLVNSATGTVWNAFYQLNLQSVVDCLCNAKTNRNVDVRFVTDTDYFSDANYTNFYAQLQNCGITVKGDNRTSLMHNKFAVVDGRYVWTGSWNPTYTGTSNDVQNAVILDSASVAGAFQREFAEFWNGRFGTAKTKGGTNEHTVAGASVKVYFSPKDGCKTNLVNVTKSATANNYFEIFTFTDASIKDAIVTNHNNGLTVRGYMDAWQAGNSSSQYHSLTNAGVNVRKDAYPGLLHHKVMLVDAGSTNNAQVVTGSFNWTGSADTANDENILILRSYDIGNIFYQQFLTNWKK
jgi:phosphatidylserine/phosphatidylglycerophosphate/cardiolipin synthase-like enzyme